MSRLLSELLGASEPDFSLMLKYLESASGQPSSDVRLTAEIITATNHKIRKLNLDPSDTNGRELYHSLLIIIQKHDDLLTKKLLQDGNLGDSNKLLAAIKQLFKGLPIPQNCWALKSSSAKRLLKATPPKNVMKQLGYRSVDSLVKRESVAEIFCALKFLESPTWMERFVAKYKSLSSSDFENRSIEILILDSAKWGQATANYAKKHRGNIVCLQEMGAIGLLPLPVVLFPGLAITLTSLVMYYIQRIRMYSVYCKLQQVKADFGLLVGRAALGDMGHAAEIANFSLPWAILQRYFASQQFRSEIFDPHVKPEDLALVSVTEVLSELIPELSFWEKSEYIGASYSDGVVSCNLLDVSLNYCNNIDYPNRLVYYMRENLWHELYVRYICQDHIERDILKQLETNMTASLGTQSSSRRKKKG